MEQAVQFMAGISFILLGLSYLFRPTDWENWLQEIEKRARVASLTFGSINILLGSFIVAFHRVWEGVPLILTVIGIIALFKGAIYVLFPQWLGIKLRRISGSMRSLLQASGLALAIIGALLVQESCAEEFCLDDWNPSVVQKETPQFPEKS